MKLWSTWPEGSEMAAIINIGEPIYGCLRIALWLPFVSVLLHIPYQRHSPMGTWIRMTRHRRRSPVLFWKQFYYDYARDSLVINGQHVSFERLEDLALQLAKEKKEVAP